MCLYNTMSEKKINIYLSYKADLFLKLILKAVNKKSSFFTSFFLLKTI